jgi:hypothetical protein
MDGNTAPHFHILWITGDNSIIDWEPFTSRDEANTMAKRLVTIRVSFVIDEFDDSCPRCEMFRLERKISNWPTTANSQRP